MTAFVCEKCGEIIDSDEFLLTCPKCKGSVTALSKMDEYIFKIKNYVKLASIREVTINDFAKEEKKDEVKHSYPSFDEVYKYVSNSESFEKFYSKLEKSISSYSQYIFKNFDGVYNYNDNPLVKKLKTSNEIETKLFEVLGISYNPNSPEKHSFNMITHRELDVNLVEIVKINIEALENLLKKIKKFVVVNSLYGTAYLINYDKKTSKIKEEDRYQILNDNVDTVTKTIDKKYVLDILSDGSDELKEMMKVYWTAFDILLRTAKVTEKVKYSTHTGDSVDNICEWYKNQKLINCYDIESLIEESDVFAMQNERELMSLYNKIIKVKIPSSINPKAIDFEKLGKGERMLEELIGLQNIKESISKIKAYFKVNKDNPNINLHMAFNGNPGTGKTEVARIIAQILYENHILPTNNVIETDRVNLVGKFVGETPHKTLARIKEAMGGVLFIDEAYSLVPENSPGDYGHEAVATLIKAMEDYRGKFCVILAGYTNEMNKMISSNPGFASRIQFKLEFPNYSRDELQDITSLMIEKKKYNISLDAMNKILDIADVKRKDPNFANAREVRNILDQVIMCQNLRCMDGKNKMIDLVDVNKYIKDANLALPTGSSGASKILSGEEQLERLIGLNSVKTNVKKIRAYAKKNKGTPNLNLHMAFTGNPGTGKTEVAHIISRVLFEAGVLPEAKVIIGNRETLVGRFVGETAVKTKEAVQKAMGGVLFIDEAYALASDIKNDFGSEAIATLIDEMENNKGKFCVVLAGYEEPLRAMIATNPGFGSRIQFYIDFPDYSRDELKQIALSFLSKEPVPYTMTDDAMEEMLDICDFYRHRDDFANARTVRKMLQDIIMNQNLRAEDELDNNEITIDDVNQYAEDNHLVKSEKKNPKPSNGLSPELIEYLNMASFKYDASKVDNLYYEQAVLSISGDGSQGTGFIIAPNGICLTCAHCLHGDGSTQKARIILALADGQKFKNYVGFTVLYEDKNNDFAVLKLEETGMNYKYIPLTFEKDSKYDSLQEFVMAGYPFGGESFSSISITEGKIASVNNIGERTVVFADMFGKPGNSGSPVIDKNTKKVIGIFWGGITEPKTHEMINCFTPTEIIWKSIK